MTRTPEHNAKIAEALRARGVGKSPTKVCPRCRKDKPRGEYRVRSNGYTESYCLPCERASNAERQRAYAAAHPEHAERFRQNNRRAQFKRKYGITLDDYDAIFEAQGGRCAVCSRGPGEDGRRYLAVDHDHYTNDVRGLLCNDCNRGIGFLGDTVERLAAAHAYLARA